MYACSSFDTPLRQEGQCPLLSLTEMYRDFELGDILPEKQSPDLFDISRYRIQCNQCRPEDSQQPRYPRLLFDSFFMYDLQQRLLLSAKKRLFWTGREFECKSCHFWHSTLEDCNIFFKIPSVVWTEGKGLIVCSYLKQHFDMLHVHMHIVFHRFTCNYTQVFTCLDTFMQRCHCYGETKTCIQEGHTHT